MHVHENATEWQPNCDHYVQTENSDDSSNKISIIDSALA